MKYLKKFILKTSAIKYLGVESNFPGGIKNFGDSALGKAAKFAKSSQTPDCLTKCFRPVGLVLELSLLCGSLQFSRGQELLPDSSPGLNG